MRNRSPLIFQAPAICALAASMGCSSGAEPDAAQLACAPGFVTSVVSVTWGTNAGYGQDKMPAVVSGAPRAADTTLKGSTDVVSLGVGGEIVLGFAGNGIADGPGADFIVFENVFYAGGDPTKPYAEPGQVSVSQDGTRWTEFPCDAQSSPYQGCAGTHPTLSNPDNGVSPFDPGVAGGEAFDLATIGIQTARYVRIVDRSASGAGTSAGFDLDAIAVVHPACD
jgi:hypothetical protein